MMRTPASQIVAAVCNAHRNSDLRADNPDILRAFDERIAELEAEKRTWAETHEEDMRQRVLHGSRIAELKAACEAMREALKSALGRLVMRGAASIGDRGQDRVRDWNSAIAAAIGAVNAALSSPALAPIQERPCQQCEAKDKALRQSHVSLSEHRCGTGSCHCCRAIKAIDAALSSPALAPSQERRRSGASSMQEWLSGDDPTELTPQQIQERREAERRDDIAMDRQYLAGLDDGWNLGTCGDRAGFDLAVRNRKREIRDALKGLDALGKEPHAAH